MKKITLLLLLLATHAQAEIPQHVKQDIDQRIKHGINPSIVIGVYEDGQSSFYIQGYQNLEQKTPASVDSVYEIGSITKTFTGLLLAQAVKQHKLTLDTAVQDHLPNDVNLEDSEARPITFKQLSTHTSGLPRMPDNIPMFTKDPYADYDQTKLWQGIKQAKRLPAGVNYQYSNLAVGLLGVALSRVENHSYNQLITERIIQPLGLTSTFMQLDEVPAQHLATGYTGNRAANPWNFKALAGAGSIRSSIKDLLAYGVAHLENSEHPLSAAMQLATTSHYQQDQLQVGLGWHISPQNILWHNGGTMGFRSIVMIDPKNNKVVAGITNHNNEDVEDIVSHLMNASSPLKTYDYPVAIEAAQLQQYIGTFYNENADKQITIKLQQGRLYFTANKQPKQRMTYIGDDTFKFGVAKVTLSYRKDDQGQVTGFEFKGWGKPQFYAKQSTP